VQDSGHMGCLFAAISLCSRDTGLSWMGPCGTQLADCVACSLDFAVLYNSDLQVRDRMRTTGPERCASRNPPLCKREHPLFARSAQLAVRSVRGMQVGGPHASVFPCFLQAPSVPAAPGGRGHAAPAHGAPQGPQGPRSGAPDLHHHGARALPRRSGAAPGAPALSKLTQAGTNGGRGRGGGSGGGFSPPTLKPGAAAAAKRRRRRRSGGCCACASACCRSRPRCSRGGGRRWRPTCTARWRSGRPSWPRYVLYTFLLYQNKKESFILQPRRNDPLLPRLVPSHKSLLSRFHTPVTSAAVRFQYFVSLGFRNLGLGSLGSGFWV